ncbi:aspartate dehydrogenase domain-containing protein [Lachnoclostridium phytofermentans]|uniref:L-aspartate dehydrogenase n=1 Tax=Lachnoclostridium phytofermentans (strain ATCC 700394 / DSM 18823 / ISDg) TaxID=357809 RepID=A9KJ78_LACP7|nr:aspartate dehydrogenase domain-containing protein [Lachnoclostridium phytofermentans]ABX42490.1 Aspartate dehydrogenase [Lachnoclostridium phytofermentans ISDg]
MEKIKLALLGCGYLNEIVANALKDGYLPEYELVAVFGRTYARTKAFADHFGCKACTDINELMEMKPDFIAEAASVKAVRDYSETILEGGSNLVVLSIGAFADGEFYERVKATAARNKRRVYIASGAVGGFDVLRTAALMSPITASFTSQKAPGSLYYTPLYKDGLLDIKEREQVFHGTTKEAIAILPTHVNVAVATALASAGPENTIINIDAVPGFRGDEYKIEIQGDEVRTELNIYSRTSKIAAWSVVAVLQNAVAPIVF